MQFIGSKLLAIFAPSLFLALSSFVYAQDVDPIFGVATKWEDLDGFKGSLLGDTSDSEYKILAETKYGASKFYFLLGRVEIKPDIHGSKSEGYEFDSGFLVKQVGNKYVPLGASSGYLWSDYPEISSELIRKLMKSYVDKFIERSGSRKSAAGILLKADVCGGLEKNELNLLISELNVCLK